MLIDVDGLTALQRRINESPTILQELAYPPEMRGLRGLSFYRDGEWVALVHVLKPAVMTEKGLVVLNHHLGSSTIGTWTLKMIPVWKPLPYYSPYDRLAPSDYLKWLKVTTVKWLEHQLSDRAMTKESRRELLALREKLMTGLPDFHQLEGKIIRK